MKLQSKILLFLIPVIVVPMLLLGWYAYQQLRFTNQEKTFEQMNYLLNHGEFTIKSKIETINSNLQLFTNSSLIKRYLRTVDLESRYTLLQPALLKLFNSYRKAFPQYYDIRLYLPDGTEDSRSGSILVGSSASTQKHIFNKVSSANTEFYTQFFWHSDKHELSLFASKQIKLIDLYFEPTLAIPKIKGYLTIYADLKKLRKSIIENVVGENGYIFLTDGQGQIVIHPNNAKEATFFPEILFKKLSSKTTVNNLIKGIYEGQIYLFKGKKINDNLFIFAALPETEIIADSRKLGVLVASILTLTILLTSTLLFLLLRYLIISPIKRLKNAAQQISSGQLNINITNNSTDEIGQLSSSFNKMSKSLQHTNQQIFHLAYHDSLTGLPNRRMFYDMVTSTLSHSKNHQLSFALMFLDLDDFKRVNDTLGHDGGDDLLKEFSKRLKNSLREDDSSNQLEQSNEKGSVSRLGGDEFIFLLQEVKSIFISRKVADRILNLVTQPYMIRNQEFYISTSIGIAHYPQDGNCIEELIKNADIAMYQAKSKGKNNFQEYQSFMSIDAVEQFAMENALRKAISSNQLQLHYQPKVHTHTGEIVGVEALLRWLHPTKGLLGSEEFIPLAEKTGLIAPLGEWVINKACHQNKIWQDQGFPILSMAVNVSNVQFDKHDLFLIVKDALASTGLEAKYLQLELTESSLMQAESTAIETLLAIKNLGVTLAMDDFGTGYSSLNALRRFPINHLKIDQCFIKHIVENNDDKAIVSAIIVMSKALNIQVIAEGIENKNQLEILQKQGCDVIQGFLISHPITAGQLEFFLENKSVIYQEEELFLT